MRSMTIALPRSCARFTAADQALSSAFASPRRVSASSMTSGSSYAAPTRDASARHTERGTPFTCRNGTCARLSSSYTAFMNGSSCVANEPMRLATATVGALAGWLSHNVLTRYLEHQDSLV